MEVYGRSQRRTDSWLSPEETRPRVPTRDIQLPRPDSSPAWAILLVLAFVVLGCRRPPTPAKPTPTSWLTLVARPSATPPAANTTARPTDTPAATPRPITPSAPILAGSLVVGTLPAPGHSPAGIAVLGSRVYVCNRGSNNVSVLESATVRDAVPVGREPSAVLADPASGRTFVLNEGDSTISVLEGTTVVATWPVPEQSTKLAIVDGQLWVGSRRGGRITVLSAKDGMALGEVKLSATGMVFQLLASADARRIYAVSYARIHMIDVATRQEVASAVLNGAGVLALPASGPGLYATGYDSATQQEYLALLDTETLSEKAQLPSVPDLAALAADPRNGRLYLISSYTNELVVLDGQSHQRLARLIVGRTPRSLALDAEKGTLYVANYDGDNVAIVDTAKLAVVATVPLALRLEGMDVDPVTGRLYVAAGSANTVYLLGEAGVLEKWPISGYPSQVRVVPGRSQVACLSLVEDKLTLLDQMGKPAEVYTTGHRPRGLMIDDMQRRIYAGDTVLEWEARITHTLRISTPAGSMESPVQMLLDTRRNRLYAVALNGIPGSNNGYVVTRIGEADADPAAPAPGKLSVVDLVYDEEMDRFYATNARMGTYGLQVSQGEDGRELLALRLDRYPAAMALNPATRHLWVVLQSVAGQATARDTQIAAYDTRTLGRVALLQVDGFVESLSVDPRNNRIYLANGDAGLIHVVQDVPMSAPAGPIPYSTPKP